MWNSPTAEEAREAARRLFDRFTVGGIVLALISIAGTDAVQRGSGMIATLNLFSSNMADLLNSGWVRIFLLAVGLILLARSGHRVIAADKARADSEATRIEAETSIRAQAIDDAQRAFKESLSELEKAASDARRLNRTLGIMLIQSEKARRHQEKAQNLLGAVNTLAPKVEQIAGGPVTSKNHARYELLGLADELSRTVVEGAELLGETAAPFDFPWDVVISRDHPEIEGAFDPSENSEFFDKHRTYIANARVMADRHQSEAINADNRRKGALRRIENWMTGDDQSNG